MKYSQVKRALLVCLLAAPLAVSGQESDAVATEAVSQKSPEKLRKDLWMAEKEFYALYNTLNDDNIYDVRCTREETTGSIMKTQVCRPKFLDRAIRDARGNTSTNVMDNSEIEAKMATFRKTLENVVATNPELQEAVAKLNKAHAEVEADKQRRAKD